MPVDRSIVRRAVADSLPLVVPIVPFAFVIGLAVIDSGINPLIGWSSSWVIFGGAAQLTVISLFGSGAAVAAVITAGLVVNARHLMYSAALAPTFQRQRPPFRRLGPYFLIDQVFALVSLRLGDDPKAFRTYYLTVGATFWIIWQTTTAVGLLVGPVIPAEWRLDFAVPLLFLGLIVIGLDRYPKLVAALVAAAVTYLWAGLPNRSSLLIGSLVGIAAGTVAERMRS